MSSLDQIKIEVGAMENRELVYSILMEIASLLDRYLKEGERGELDLKGLPLNEADRTALDRVLGEGEITMQLKVMGDSQIIETAYAGVWRVIHRDGEGRLVADLIEVAVVPSIVAAHAIDMKKSIDRLCEFSTQSLGNNSTKN